MMMILTDYQIPEQRGISNPYTFSVIILTMFSHSKLASGFFDHYLFYHKWKIFVLDRTLNITKNLYKSVINRCKFRTTNIHLVPTNHPF